VGEVRAGEVSTITVQPGEALQIMTGAPVPDGADAVVMVEDTQEVSDNTITVLKDVREGQNIAPRGSERKAGETVIRAPKRIGSVELAVLAAVGKPQVAVYRRPMVAILPTGDELVPVEANPGPGQIRNSNSFSLWAQVLDSGGAPTLLDTARDNLPELRRNVQLGLEANVLLVSGGVSMGKYDLVEQVFVELGIQIHFNAVSMRPGKPTVFATQGSRFVFGLPGNPLSTFVAFELFVKPVLQRLQGLPAERVSMLEGVLETDIVEKSGRSAFLPAHVTTQADGFHIVVVPWKGSADVFGAVEANALLVVPSEVSRLNRGERAQALLFGALEHAVDPRL
jgi:molybdopterin molybdotransferase